MGNFKCIYHKADSVLQLLRFVSRLNPERPSKKIQTYKDELDELCFSVVSMNKNEMITLVHKTVPFLERLNGWVR